MSFKHMMLFLLMMGRSFLPRSSLAQEVTDPAPDMNMDVLFDEEALLRFFGHVVASEDIFYQFGDDSFKDRLAFRQLASSLGIDIKTIMTSIPMNENSPPSFSIEGAITTEASGPFEMYLVYQADKMTCYVAPVHGVTPIEIGDNKLMFTSFHTEDTTPCNPCVVDINAAWTRSAKPHHYQKIYELGQ